MRMLIRLTVDLRVGHPALLSGECTDRKQWAERNQLACCLQGLPGGQADSRSLAAAAPMLRRAQRPSVGNIGPAPFSAADPGRL
jgi:hypothetical protein